MAEPPKTNPIPPIPPLPSSGGNPEPPKAAVPPRPSIPAATPPAPPRPATPPPPPPPAPKPRRGVVLPLLLAILLLLVGGFVYLAVAQPQQLMALLQTAGVPTGAAASPELQNQVATLQRRLSALEQRPNAPTVDLRPLEQRIAALEQRAPGGPAVDLRPLEQRVAALEARPVPVDRGPAPTVDLSPLQQRVAALEQQAAEATAQLGTKLDNTATSLASRLQAVEQNHQSVSARAARVARLQAATVALDAGRPLGDIPGAPPALGRFATTPPPTLASLRLSFDTAAAAAEKASAPTTEGLSMGDRMLQQAQKLVTLRDGEKVLVGAPAARVLAQARSRLEAGDLRGTVDALEGLDSGAAKAMADWRAQAQSLLDARAALAGLANS